ncbi:hypothetical protein [Ruegeria sp.]|uniref:hypothetical protein n=1 Tax=Ruegeria sp. TaxID=1879320 RepID=UPI003AFFD0A9
MQIATERLPRLDPATGNPVGAAPAGPDLQVDFSEIGSSMFPHQNCFDAQWRFEGLSSSAVGMASQAVPACIRRPVFEALSDSERAQSPENPPSRRRWAFFTESSGLSQKRAGLAACPKSFLQNQIRS